MLEFHWTMSSRHRVAIDRYLYRLCSFAMVFGQFRPTDLLSFANLLDAIKENSFIA